MTPDHLSLLEASDQGRGNAVRLGRVTAFDAQRCRVRVAIADASDAPTQTHWIPWGTWAAGHLRVWSPPAVGEQCVILAPSGEFAQAIAMPAVYQQAGAYPAPSDNPEHTVLQWDDGTFIRYDRSERKLHIHSVNEIAMTAQTLIRIQSARVEIN